MIPEAALINIFILKMGQMTTCKVKEVTHREETCRELSTLLICSQPRSSHQLFQAAAFS